MRDSSTGSGGADLAAMRRSYERAGVDADDLGPDPFAAFGRWLADAVGAGVVEPNAMVLATVGADGVPAARTVLLKGYDHRGLRFFTNLGSAKAAELAAHPVAALVFPWHAVARQVRVTGRVAVLPRDEVEAYFGSRPRASQLGAWASRQSSPVGSRAELEATYAEIAARFPDDVPTPPFWGGYVVAPETWEFWAGRTGRLHDRLRYRRTGSAGGAAPSGSGGTAHAWTLERLAP